MTRARPQNNSLWRSMRPSPTSTRCHRVSSSGASPSGTARPSGVRDEPGERRPDAVRLVPGPNPCDTPVGRQRYWDGTAWTSAWTERAISPTVPTTAPTVAVPAVAKRRGEAMSNGKIE